MKVQIGVKAIDTAACIGNNLMRLICREFNDSSRLFEIVIENGRLQERVFLPFDSRKAAYKVWDKLRPDSPSAGIGLG